MLSSLCCTQTTGTSAARALSIAAEMLARMASRSCASATTDFCTSMTRRADCERPWRVVMRATLDRGYDTFREQRAPLPLLQRLDPGRLLLGDHVADPVPMQRHPVAGGEALEQRSP